MMVPSTNGPVTYGPFALGVPCSWRIRAAVKARRHAALPVQPAAAANLLPRSNAVWREVQVGVEGGATSKLAVGELWLIARLNSPVAPGDIKFALVSCEPADWAERDFGGVATEVCDISLNPT